MRKHKRFFAVIVALVILCSFSLQLMRPVMAANYYLSTTWNFLGGRGRPDMSAYTFDYTGSRVNGWNIHTEKYAHGNCSLLKVMGDGAYSGERAFCIQPNRISRNGANVMPIRLRDAIKQIYSFSNSEAERIEKRIGLIGYFGWNAPDVTKSDLNYVATAHSIWHALGWKQRPGAAYAPSPAVADRIQVIEEKVHRFEQKPSFHGQSLTLQPGMSETLRDTSGALSQYMVGSGIPANQEHRYGGFTVYWDGKDTLRITADDASPVEKTLSFRNIAGGHVGTPLGFQGNTQGVTITKATYTNTFNLDISVEHYGRFELIKWDQYGRPFTGQAVFNLFDAAGNKVHLRGSGGRYVRAEGKDTVTDFIVQDGRAVIDQLLPGNYTLKEIAVDADYKISEHTPEVIIRDNQATVLHFRNILKNGNLEIIKTDPDGQELDGAIFELLDENGAVCAFNLKDDGSAVYTPAPDASSVMSFTVNGRMTLRVLPVGKYILRELTPPRGYAVTETEGITVTIESDRKEVKTVVNALKACDLELRKIDNYGIPVDVACGFELYRDGELVKLVGKSPEYFRHQGQAKYVTTAYSKNGLLIIRQLEPGDYILREVSTGKDYEINPDDLTFTITDDQSEQSVNFTNTRRNGSLKVIKVNQANEPLAGAIFELFDETGTPVNVIYDTASGTYRHHPLEATSHRFTTDENGSARIEQLPIGKYFLHEVEAPAGYEIIDISDEIFEIKPNEVTTKTIVNRPDMVNVTLLKQDTAGNPVANVVFEIAKAQDFSDAVQLTTDAEGKIFYETAPDVRLYVREVEAPAPFLIDPEIQTLLPTVNGPNRLLFTDPVPYGTVTVRKQDSDGMPLGGARIRLTLDRLTYPEQYPEWRERIGTILEATTGETGVLMQDALPPGEYTVTEIAAPSGYVRDENVHAFTLAYKDQMTAELTAEVTLTNLPQKGVIRLYKADPLRPDAVCDNFSRAEFAILHVPANDVTAGSGNKNDAENETKAAGIDEKTRVEPEIVATMTTDESGRATSPPLPLGVYDIVELTAPHGYTVNETGLRVQLAADPSGAEFIGEEHIIPLSANAQSAIDALNQRVDEFNEMLLTKHIDRDPMPRYTARDLADDPVLTFYDRHALGRIELTKTIDQSDPYLPDDETIAEAGVEFGLYLDDAEVDRLITDTAGYATSQLLPPGNYTLKQLTVADGLKKVEDQSVTIDEDRQLIALELTNQPILTRLRIVKTDAESGNPLPVAGVRFSLYAEDGTVLAPGGVEVFETNADGIAVFPEKLRYGTYRLREIEGPEGYFLDPEGEDILIEINSDSIVLSLEEIVVEVPNIPQKGRLVLEKIGDLFQGWQETVFNFKDDSFPLFEPVFEQGYLAGCVFELRAAEDIVGADGALHYAAGETVQTMTTDGTGPGIFNDVPLGRYELAEIGAPPGYVVDPEVYPIEFTPQASEVRVHLIEKESFNERVHYRVRINSKTFEESSWHDYHIEAPAETLFGLRTTEALEVSGHTLPAGSIVSLSGLDANLTAEFSAAFPGRYELCELRTHEAYRLADPVAIEFVDETEQEAERIVEIETVANELTEGRIIVRKHSSHDDAAPLPGAVFKLYVKIDDDLVEIGEYISDAEGIIRIEHLEIGEYYLREVKPPAGFTSTTDYETIIIRPDDAEITYERENSPTETYISKQDVHGKEIPGAHLELRDAEGNLIESWISSDTPHCIYGLIEGARYELIEVAAPDGYLKSGDSVFFTIEEGKPTYCVMVNKRKPEVPEKPSAPPKTPTRVPGKPNIPRTGEMNHMGRVGGTFLILLGVTAILRYQVRKRRVRASLQNGN